VEFGVISNPVIEEFSLPEGYSSSSKDLVGEMTAGAFDGSCDFTEGLAGTEEQVDVVRHYHPGKELAELPLLFGYEERVYDCVCDFGAF
jgi:hypothetical protein